MVTIDLVELRTVRDGLRLLRRPRQAFDAEPEFAGALLSIRDWRWADPRHLAVVAAWAREPGDLQLNARETWRGVFESRRTHGTLHGRDPLAPRVTASSDGPGVIWTAGNCKVRRLPQFLKQNQKVVKEL